MSLSFNFSVITSKKPFNVNMSRLSGFLLKFEIIERLSLRSKVLSLRDFFIFIKT